MGIAKGELATLFTTFSQTESGRALQEGTGLGLALSQQLVRLMGGDIRVESQVGRGSRFFFTVYVPVPGQEIVAHYEQGRRRPVGLEPDQPRRKLLVADDNDHNRKMLVQLLAALPGAVEVLEVLEATNGQEAIDVWQTRQPDLIFMDVRMPVLDGLEATRRIKAQQAGLSPTIIIAVTASAFEDDRQGVLAAGCDDFLRKPLRKAELYEMLSKHLSLRLEYAQPAPEVEEAEETALDPHLLVNLSPAWLAAMRHATIVGDVEEMLALIVQIPHHSPSAGTMALADRLATLVNQFEYEPILRWLEQGD